MKRAIVLGLLTVLLVIGVGCFGAPQGAISPDTFTTFADWCRHRDSLLQAPRHTVEELLAVAETQECNRAEEILTNRTNLDLDLRRIVDVAPLANLTNLTGLSLNGNDIVDINPLASLTNLTKLYLNGNNIMDINPLASLTNLTLLGLSLNQIADVTPIASLTNLTLLGLSANQIANVAPSPASLI
ncbi:MAG: leucine-rich repeat domain-containing protein [Cyanobacteria bacterium J06559_3]